MKYIKYLIEVFGFPKLILYIFLWIFRPLLRMNTRLLDIYKEKAYANKILYLKQLNNVPANNLQYKSEIKSYFNRYGIKINTYWHYCYAHINGNLSVKYIPEFNYYTEIEPRLNNLQMSDAYGDKNIYDQLFKGVHMPDSSLRCMNGVYHDKFYTKLLNEEDVLAALKPDQLYIAKPSIDGQGGKGIYKFMRKNESLFLGDEKLSPAELPHKYQKDFIIQPFVNQHASIKKVYPHSLNTIRVLTLRLDHQIKILSMVIRFGNHGGFVDNNSAGGLCCGVKFDGSLKYFGMDIHFKKYKSHPYTGIPFDGVQIPNINKVKLLAKELHEKMIYFDIISWDIALDINSDPVFIEMNLKDQGINFHQTTNGPLFGDYTDQIMGQIYLRG